MQKIIEELILKLKLFKGADKDELFKLLGDAEIKEYNPGELISKKDEYSENCAIVAKGSVAIEVPQAKTNKTMKVVLGAGEIVGEIAVLSGNPSTANIKAETAVTLVVIPKKKLLKLIDKVPVFKKGLDDLYRERALKTHLMKCHIFSGVSNTVLEKLAETVTLHTFKKDEVIFNQGDVSDAFYLVRYGFV
ncbi:MAG: cyclic nucleotide-binding domain-containing protein, partial [Thermodesulfobacteriota bacterium]